MKLEDTIELMKSDDFKDRFKAEYHQLLNRRDGLSAMLSKYKLGTLLFKPKCSYDILYCQLTYMDGYLKLLEKRAKIEDIEL